MYKNSIVHYLAKIIVDLLLYLGIPTVCTVPWWSKFISDYMQYTNSQGYILAAVLFTSGAVVVYILFVLKGMFKTLLGNNPFVKENVNAFRRMAVACLAISAIYLVKCFVLFSVGTVVISVIFGVGTLFCLTLKDIFKQAVYYKEENDWTV